MTKLFTSWLLLAMLSLNVVATHTPDPDEPVAASAEQEITAETEEQGEIS